MFTYANARRTTLLFLFLALSVAGAMGPANAMLIPGPDPNGTSGAGGSQGQTDGAVSSGAGLLPWVLIGLAVALVVAGVVAVALRRYGRTHRAVLPAS